MFLLAVLFVVGVAVAVVAAAVLAISGNRRKRTWAALVGGPLGCAIVPVVGVLLLLALGSGWLSIRPASTDFAQVFGVEPTAAITNLQAKAGGGFDSSHVYLAFDRTDAALAEVLARGSASLASPASARVAMAALDGPAWWRSASTCARRVERDVAYASRWDSVVVVDCPVERRVYVLASSID